MSGAAVTMWPLRPWAEDDPRNPRLDPRYAGIPDAELPRTESLRDTVARTMPCWVCEILPALARYDQVLVVAHGNSLRGIIKSLKGISDEAFGVQPSDSRALCLRIRRGAGLCEGLFPGRSRRDRLPDGGRCQPGQAGLRVPFCRQLRTGSLPVPFPCFRPIGLRAGFTCQA